MKDIIILGIESSCDDTSAAVLKNGVLLSNVTASQDVHRAYGGVVPELASRAHQQNIVPVVDQALKRAGVKPDDLSAIAVTLGPGLMGSLLVGVSFAKGMATSLGIPLIEANHLQGHILALFLKEEGADTPVPPLPYLCLLVSGGNSQIVKVDAYNKMEILGQTIDDAAGEAFDKVARALGLNYPGGPELEKLAREGNANAYSFRGGFNESDNLDFSFSGIKTAVVNLMHNAEQKGETLSRADIAASFQRSVVDTLCQKVIHAAKLNGVNTLALAGGVSANTALRTALEKAAHRANLRFCRPDMRFCTDNAAMIACAAHYALLESAPSELSLNAEPSKELAE